MGNKLGRNEACHCGSGLKYKRCCLDEDNRLALEQSRELFRSALVEELEGYAGLMAFHEFFPDTAEEENRALWANDRDPRTREPYQLIEFYCADPKCDCNRVVLAVADREQLDHETILSVGFAFDRNDPEPGPYIDPLNPVTRDGESIYPLIENMLMTDAEYVARLKRHYEMVKKKIKGVGKMRHLVETTAAP